MLQISGEVKFVGDAYPGAYAHGISMLGSDTMHRFGTVSEENGTKIYQTDDAVILQVRTTRGKQDGVTTISTAIKNGSEREITLEMMTSFLISGIKADKVHRMLSCWSSEGLHRVDEFGELNMEVSWTHHAPRFLKFGNVGSMPVRTYFPFVALEDSETGHFTAVQLYSPSSWQIEVIRHHEADRVNLAGGIADRDFGQWTKKLAPGEIFTAPKAVVAEGDSLLEVCGMLVEEQTPDRSPLDDGMGITFNEYCTTWGNPTIDNLKRIADRLEGKGIRYLVMDSGWYLKQGQYWWDYIGKWDVNPERFPNGLKELSDYVRSKGMIPGIWFEPETVAWGSDLYEKPEYLLTRDGCPLTVGGRRFLDMEADCVRDFLRDKVIRLLKENDFGYLKIDYNDTIGMGCDGIESPGENLRRKVLAAQDFFRELRKEIPNLVIENCSSGGHRLEPSMMELSSMASFSDAHETLAIPLIAAGLQRLVRPEQNQIWAVLRKDDSDERISYSLCATMFGRMGLSGDIYDLSEHQWKLVDEGIAFYREAADIIQKGRTVILDVQGSGRLHPTGSQFCVRRFENRYLAVLHRFEDDGNGFTLPVFIREHRTVREFGCIEQCFGAKAWILSD